MNETRSYLNFNHSILNVINTNNVNKIKSHHSSYTRCMFTSTTSSGYRLILFNVTIPKTTYTSVMDSYASFIDSYITHGLIKYITYNTLGIIQEPYYTYEQYFQPHSM